MKRVVPLTRLVTSTGAVAGSSLNLLPVADIADLQVDKIAASQLAIQAQVEKSQFTHSALQLQPYTIDATSSARG
ncbi:MAG: hypothetical protein ABS94_03095 [Variovorax sp. SCN 67-85]|nr:MAG: hypothetical protein ABS94_03095 [Variovorax sp. SCN 67-85]ODV16043.1 MAG: hypothetical protein ABT25_31905 [Variovorax sp. SCN 67-20]